MAGVVKGQYLVGESLCENKKKCINQLKLVREKRYQPVDIELITKKRWFIDFANVQCFKCCAHAKAKSFKILYFCQYPKFALCKNCLNATTLAKTCPKDLICYQKSPSAYQHVQEEQTLQDHPQQEEIQEQQEKPSEDDNYPNSQPDLLTGLEIPVESSYPNSPSVSTKNPATPCPPGSNDLATLQETPLAISTFGNATSATFAKPALEAALVGLQDSSVKTESTALACYFSAGRDVLAKLTTKFFSSAAASLLKFKNCEEFCKDGPSYFKVDDKLCTRSSYTIFNKSVEFLQQLFTLSFFSTLQPQFSKISDTSKETSVESLSSTLSLVVATAIVVQDCLALLNAELMKGSGKTTKGEGLSLNHLYYIYSAAAKLVDAATPLPPQIVAPLNATS
ncbi:hypothetical protein BDR26DRAFT_903540 [Obelidium mucronatum]|nr:hypothetical protein BDR26DRAFT_903540 [Obelidium mucronatum]